MRSGGIAPSTVDGGKLGGLDRGDDDWEQFARRDPYWAVLTDERFRTAKLSAARRAEFFAAGEKHMAAVFAWCEEMRPAPWSPRRALDFGCGVGRLLPALARRCAAVVGADVSEAMLAEAATNRRRMAMSNVELVRSDDELRDIQGGFDLIHSVIVFQHIAPVRGEAIFARLCGLLAEDGVAVLHFTTGSRRGVMASQLSDLRDRVRPVNAVANLLAGRAPGNPPMRMYEYSAPRLEQLAADCGCDVVARRDFAVPGHNGILLCVARN